MNAYDFDGTIYAGDCSIEFALFCCKHHPKMWVTFFPKAVFNLGRYKQGSMSRAKMMKEFFTFLKKDNLKDFNKLIKKFWDQNEKKISKW